MSEWKKVKLGEIGKIITGKTPPTKDKDNYGGNIPFITPVDMVGNRNVFITERYLTEKGKNVVKNCLLPANTICVSCIGSDMGKAVITTQPSITNQQINSIIVDDAYDFRFVFYLMLTQTDVIKSLGKNSTAVPILNKSKFCNIEVSLPSLSTQHRIATILSRYDSLIENYQKQIKLLEEAAQRLYKEWFVDLHFPGHENTKIVDGVPEGWEKKTIADVCTNISSGSTPSRSNKAYWENGTIKWVKTKELQDGWIFDTEEYISQEGYNSSSTKIFPVNTILMAIYASPTLGRLGILSTDCCCNQAALGLIADENIISWQWLFWKLYELRDEFNAIARGAGQQNISGIVVKNKEIIIPDKGVIDGFTSVVSKMFEQQKSLSSQIRLLTEARDRLLPKLMSGEIAV